jgi:hypothetical protein
MTMLCPCCSAAMPESALAPVLVRVSALKTALVEAAHTHGTSEGGELRLYTMRETEPLVESHLLGLCKLAEGAEHFTVMALYYLARMYAAFKADDRKPKRAAFLVGAAVRSLKKSAPTEDGKKAPAALLGLLKEHNTRPFRIINDEAAAMAGALGGSVERYWQRVLAPASVNSSSAKKFQLWARFYHLATDDFFAAYPDAAKRADVYEKIVRGATDPSAVMGVNREQLVPGHAPAGEAAAAAAVAGDGGGGGPAAAAAAPAGPTVHVDGPLSHTRRFSQFSMLANHSHC